VNNKNIVLVQKEITGRKSVAPLVFILIVIISGVAVGAAASYLHQKIFRRKKKPVSERSRGAVLEQGVIREGLWEEVSDLPLEEIPLEELARVGLLQRAAEDIDERIKHLLRQIELFEDEGKFKEAARHRRELEDLRRRLEVIKRGE